MHDDGLTLVNLRDCLASVEPVRLSGMTLFEQQGHPRGAFPTFHAKNWSRQSRR